LRLAALRQRSLVVASNNLKKLAELRALLEPLGVPVHPQGDFAVPEVNEPYPTFVENALAKARHASRLTGRPALADDSGLCVEALGGAPGVASAHYADITLHTVGFTAGEARETLRLQQDAANNEKLLRMLETAPHRAAAYVCVLVLVDSPDDPLPIIATGLWRGEIASTPSGSGGFGYDPLFWLPDHGCSVADLPPQTKTRISHRAQAMAALSGALQGA
jgi:XTP/dITP diphosphohydrolase